MNNLKAVNVRISKELWLFARKKSIDREMSFNKLIEELLINYKKKCEKKLTDKDVMVSLHHQEISEV